MKYVLVLGVAAAVAIADQITKWIVIEHIPLYESIVVFPSFFQLTHLKNTGGAFGLFRDAHEALRLPFFLGVGVLAVGVLLYFVHRVPSEQKFLLFALGGILGGAVGNFIDRATAGEVTDFLYFHWREYYWPAFNVADTFISLGALILVAFSLFVRDDPKPS